MGPLMQYAGERSLDDVTLLVYPEGSSSFELYEDDGRTNAYRRGDCPSRVTFDGVTIPSRTSLGAPNTGWWHMAPSPSCAYELEAGQW
jgi:hypothetical protein